MTTPVRPAPGPAREYHFPRFDREVLANGVHVVVAPVKKLPVVTVLAVIDAGATRDERGKEGVAELTAQGIREGTTGRDGLQLAMDLERLGTSLECGADWDSTIASMTVLRERLEPAFTLFGEALTTPAFPDAVVERLKAERLAERLQILSEPRGLADESFSRFVYDPRARYAAPLAGNAASIAALERQDVVDFHRSTYTATGLTLILAGEIETGDAVQLVNSAFQSWYGTPARPNRSADAPARQSRAVEIVAKPDAPQSELRIGHVGLPRSHQDYFKIGVMNAVLGGLFSSRINLNLREAHGYTYGASSAYEWRRSSGPFVISTAVQSEVTAPAISEIIKEIDGLRTEEIPEEELSLATSYLAGVFPIRYETTAAIAAALANMVTFGLSSDYYDTYRERVRGVTTSDVLLAAQNHVHADQLQTVIVGEPELVRRQLDDLDIGQIVVRDMPKP